MATHTVYQYSLAGPTGDFQPGVMLPLVWKATPRLVSGAASFEEKARLCVALAGPYNDVGDLKSSYAPVRACPIAIAGLIIASDVSLADLLIGTPVDQSLVLPATLAPGYYNLISVMEYGTTGTAQAMSAAGIVHVVAAR